LLLAQQGIVVFPSAVPRHNWNLVFEPQVARVRYVLKAQERFATGRQLHSSGDRAVTDEATGVSMVNVPAPVLSAPAQAPRRHFVLMRAVVQGLDGGGSWECYLRVEGDADDRRAAR
jgi:hypothetical protein